MASVQIKNKGNAQAIYMNFLLELALHEAKLERQSTHRAFDPQNRLLVNVPLSDDKINKIMIQTNNPQLPNDKKGLEKALGRTISATTTVSLDTSQDDKLNSEFHVKYPGSGSNKTQQSTGSVIALQQEFHFHLNLCARLYQQLYP